MVQTIYQGDFVIHTDGEVGSDNSDWGVGWLKQSRGLQPSMNRKECHKSQKMKTKKRTVMWWPQVSNKGGEIVVKTCWLWNKGAAGWSTKIFNNILCLNKTIVCIITIMIHMVLFFFFLDQCKTKTRIKIRWERESIQSVETQLEYKSLADEKR